MAIYLFYELKNEHLSYSIKTVLNIQWECKKSPCLKDTYNILEKKKIHSMFLLKIIELQTFNKAVVSKSNCMSPYKHDY